MQSYIAVTVRTVDQVDFFSTSECLTSEGVDGGNGRPIKDRQMYEYTHARCMGRSSSGVDTGSALDCTHARRQPSHIRSLQLIIVRVSGRISGLAVAHASCRDRAISVVSMNEPASSMPLPSMHPPSPISHSFIRCLSAVRPMSSVVLAAAAASSKDAQFCELIVQKLSFRHNALKGIRLPVRLLYVDH